MGKQLLPPYFISSFFSPSLGMFHLNLISLAFLSPATNLPEERFLSKVGDEQLLVRHRQLIEFTC